ncbi:MAG: peptide chain release factor 3 [Clostridia bacterium]|nr:peptide chain release factor 3 [Clostridia bacterium]
MNSEITFTGKGSPLANEIARRRTFAIISHPDAGKTTLTEKFLLYGGAIQSAGSVKGKQSDRHAVSDWMEMEKKRGISITSSVMQFEYEGYCINILDTPGHQDFSEDTYRTLMAADSAVMVIDAAKGIEPQTRKLFKVCAMRHIPIFTFINKLDRDARDPFDLLDELESEFGIGTYPMNWPIGCGVGFKGVYERDAHRILAFGDAHRGRDRLSAIECDINDTDKLDALIGQTDRETLTEQVELLDGACFDFDIEKVRCGKLSPVFFGSALNNFGIETFLEHFLKMTSGPIPRRAGDRVVDPFEEKEFSAFVFKIQANMNKAHRDRIAFMRIVSGRFDRNEEYMHVQGGRTLKLSQPQQMMAAERAVIDEAFAGDIIGVFDPGIFSIGDTVCAPKMKLEFEGIPNFAPERFAVVEQIDSMKRKQFAKGMNQIAQEGAIRIFIEPDSGMERVYVGVVGELQYDVLESRMQNEYNVEYRKYPLPYTAIRRVPDGVDPKKLHLYDVKWVQDFRGKNYLLFNNEWHVGNTLQNNEGLVLEEYGQEYENE